jgi:DNA-binding transcriptional LysR family regulator
MTQHLDLRVLASFLVLAEELSFTQAARRLHMTQPPLSLQIKQLEAQLQTLLFERTKRSVRLTAAGEALRIEVEKLFEFEHRARQIVARVGRGEDVGHIAVGFTPAATIDLVPSLLKRFSAQVPGILYSLKEAHSDAQMAALLRNELDVALLRPPVVDSRLEARCLLTEPQVLAVPESHALATRAKVHVKHLHNEMLATYERRLGRYAHDLMMTWLTQHDVVPARLHDVVQHHAMMALVSAGIGIALVPASVARQPVNGVVFRRLSGPAPPRIELWMACRKERTNPMTQLFLDAAMAFATARRPALPP